MDKNSVVAFINVVVSLPSKSGPYADLRPTSSQCAGTREVTVQERVGGAIGEGEDREGGVTGGVLGKRRPADDEQVRHLPVLQPGVDDARVRGSADDRATLD